jgi:hypothetical protein
MSVIGVSVVTTTWNERENIEPRRFFSCLFILGWNNPEFAEKHADKTIRKLEKSYRNPA